jgi:G3E family GTPase
VLTQAADPLLADTVMRQLEAADLLVVNQCDRVPATALGRLRVWLDDRLPRTPRYETTFARVPGELLGADLLGADLLPAEGRVLGRAPRLGCAATGCDAEDHSHHGEDSKHGEAPEHGSLFDTWTMQREGSYRSGDLRALIRAMPAGVLRLKGVIRTEPGWAVLQFAGRHGSLRPWPAAMPEPAGAVAGTLVAIGLRGHLPVETLHNALDAAAAADAAPEASAGLAGI